MKPAPLSRIVSVAPPTVRLMLMLASVAFECLMMLFKDFLHDAVEIDPQSFWEDVVYVIEFRGETVADASEAVRIMPSMALLNPSRSNWKGRKL